MNAPARLSVVVAMFLATSTSLFAQSAPTKRLDVAVNGFDLNEAAAKDALAAGADINWKNDAMGGETMLIVAIKGFKEPKVIRFLLDNGADASLTDDSGKTALVWARQYNIGRNGNGRGIIAMLEAAGGGTKPANAGPTVADPKPAGGAPAPRARTASPARPMEPGRRSADGGPTADDIKAMLEQKFTSIYEDHFGGTEKSTVTFEWLAPVVLGGEETRGRIPLRCWAARIDVKVNFTRPSGGERGSVRRGINGSPVKEGFCIYRDAYNAWTYLTYAP